MKNQLNWQHCNAEISWIRSRAYLSIFFALPFVSIFARSARALSCAVESKHKRESEIKTALAHAGMLNEKCFVLLV